MTFNIDYHDSCVSSARNAHENVKCKVNITTLVRTLLKFSIYVAAEHFQGLPLERQTIMTSLMQQPILQHIGGLDTQLVYNKFS